MKIGKPATLAFLALLLSPSAFANLTGIDFTAEEIEANRTNAYAIADSAASCLTATYDDHLRFFERRKYSKYYGNRKPEHKTLEGRKQVLMRLLPQLAKKVKAGDRAAIAELNAREQELEAISCIGLALKCLGQGFQSAGMGETWDKIYAFVGRRDAAGTLTFYGTDLQKALVDLGWKSLYWNPDVSRNETWDQAERALNPPKEGMSWNPVWGGHALHWAKSRTGRGYFGIPVQDIQTLVNFGTEPPEDFKAVPFFVGTAHAGYHVFPGFSGKVIEAHSMRNLNSKNNLEVGEFNPLNQAMNGVQGGHGAPTWTNSEHYRSGMIVVPPGMISDKPFTPPGPSMSTPPDGAPTAPEAEPTDIRPSRDRNDDGIFGGIWDRRDDEPRQEPRQEQRQKKKKKKRGFFRRLFN